MLKKFASASILALGIATATISNAGYAAGTGPTVIATINIEKVERSSVAWKSLSKQIDAERSKLQAEVQRIQAELEAKAKDLKSQESILSGEAFAAKSKEFQKERLQLQRQVNIRKQKLEHAYGVARSQIHDALRQVLRKLMKDSDIDLILENGSRTTSVLAADTSLSIDEKALKGLDATIQSVSLPDPSGTSQ